MILVVLPVAKELNALLNFFVDEGREVLPGGDRVPSAVVPSLGIRCAAAGHGKALFALTTQHLIDMRGPFAAVVAAGVAGALHAALRPLDVIVGTESVEHDYKPRFGGVWPPPRHPAAPELLSALATVRPDGFGVHRGPIAGGDEDIVDAARARELADTTGALCVAWEGAGGARAAAFNGLPFVEIRAVTDSADSAGARNYRDNLPAAIGNVGRVLLAWLGR